MNARIALRLRRPAATPSTRESVRAAHLWRGHELVSDGPDMPPHIAPVVYCRRELPGWSLIPRTVLRGVIR